MGIFGSVCISFWPIFAMFCLLWDFSPWEELGSTFGAFGGFFSSAERGVPGMFLAFSGPIGGCSGILDPSPWTVSSPKCLL